MTPLSRLSTNGRLIYAIGDIHGRDDLFAALVSRLRSDALQRPALDGRPPLLILLGDYIDRGPGSAQVLERIVHLRQDPAFELRCLLGNHEDAMLDFLDHKTTGAGWLKHGGGPTMASYGVVPPTPGADRERLSRARHELIAAVPPSHRTLLETLDVIVEVGDYLFVHAGLRPGVALAAQDRRDLLWIRRGFLESDHGFDQVIVHGHSPTEQPVLAPKRIGLDTGAYFSGLLSAVRLDGARPELLQVRPGHAAVRDETRLEI